MDFTMGEPVEIGGWKHISVLGSGAFGVVTLWRNQTSETSVAIKKCKFQKPSMISSKQKDRWNKEVEFMKSCNHQNIVKFQILPPEFENFLQKYNPTKLPLMSMEYCRKGNLRRFLLSEPLRLCGLKETDVRDVLGDVLNGLSYLHSKNIMHRDLKPENIVLQHCDSRKGNTVYKIIDLGYAKKLEYTIQSQVGTIHYLAPEIFEYKQYNHSVDYWSFGLLVFEIICGILPFLPEMTPFERFIKIREKSPEDICIYLQFSGAIASSAQIKKENFVTTCLKEEVEVWLKGVLQYDSTKRSFSNTLGVFEYLQFILDKKFIKVFSLYKLEWYSYEVYETTRVGTLKEWIARDIKIASNELIFLCNDEEIMLNKDADQLIFDQITEDVVIFVVKKGALLSDKMDFNLPKSIRELLFRPSDMFPPKFARTLYRQVLFFVYKEKLSVGMLKQLSSLLLKYLKLIFDELGPNKESACESLSLLLKNVNQYKEEKKSTCDLDLSENQEAKDFLQKLKSLLVSCEKSLSRYMEFLVQYEALRRIYGEVLDRRDIDKALEACDIDEQLSKINSKSFLETREGEPDFVKRLSQVISQTMRLKKNHIYKNQYIKNWFKDFCIVVKSIEDLTSWATKFNEHIKVLSKMFLLVAEDYRKCVERAVEKKHSENQVDSAQLLKENQTLRYQFDDVISQTFLVHKNFTDDLDSML